MDRMEVKFASDSVDVETGSFTGYGAVFGNVDSYGDVIVPGAFKQSLKDWKREKALPPMLSQHGGWMMGDMDAIPVGVWTDMQEDDVGLKVAGRIINLDTERGKTIRGAMKEGALNGLSIGYRAKKFTLGTKPDEPRRKLEMIDLIETSVVTFPANGLARVDPGSVKSAHGIKTIRDFEDFLRDAGGFSHAAAKRIAAGGFKGLDPRDEDGTDIVAALRRNLKILGAN
ncbi:HK97 family phage prohead protease [Pleomorphomonas oryzae]|uniref:HK97 family phage prohead protease n=1 Tax=Pleomorphomonas oryzae TaxID=261934 RepID=UPI0004152E4E|nr:HK97 family phage prohead protease [Pleomorphomonas oryzae]